DLFDFATGAAERSGRHVVLHVAAPGAGTAGRILPPRNGYECFGTPCPVTQVSRSGPRPVLATMAADAPERSRQRLAATRPGAISITSSKCRRHRHGRDQPITAAACLLRDTQSPAIAATAALIGTSPWVSSRICRLTAGVSIISARVA